MYIAASWAFFDGLDCFLAFGMAGSSSVRKIPLECGRALLLVGLAESEFFGSGQGVLLFPLFLLLSLLMRVEPIGRRAAVLDAVDEEGGGRDPESGEAARPLVHGGVRDPHP